MKIVQSAYYKNNLNKERVNNGNKYLLNFYSMLLSYIKLKQHYGNVTIYCNDFANENLVKFIPYDEIVINNDVEHIFNDYKNSWYLVKLETYKKINEPFIHVDTDAILFEDILSEFIINNEYDFLAQSADNYSNMPYYEKYYNENKIKFNDLGLINLDFKHQYDDSFIFSCGVVGFRNLSFMEKYINHVYELHKVVENQNNFSTEEFGLFCAYTLSNVKPYLMLPYEFTNSIGLEKTSNMLKYSHLPSDSKYFDMMILLLRKKIITEHHEYYKYIVEFEKYIANMDVKPIKHNKHNKINFYDI